VYWDTICAFVQNAQSFKKIVASEKKTKMNVATVGITIGNAGSTYHKE